jgi:hypothetical protein
MTLYYSGFHASPNDTTVHQFWGDIHVLTFRADQLITDFETLKEAVERFTKDRDAFDQILYNGYPETKKANRFYDTLIPTQKILEKIVFEYEGKIYSTMTHKLSKVRHIQKNATKIIEHKEITMKCLENDRTGDIAAHGEIISEYDKLNDEDWF